MAKYLNAHAVGQSWLDTIDKPPVRWQAGHPFETLDICPGRVMLIGGPPGCGKTTLTLQVMLNLLEAQPNLRAVVGNVEMAPDALYEKMLARLACVSLKAIMLRKFIDSEKLTLQEAVIANADKFRRIEFLQPPFSMSHVKAAMVESRAQLAIVDYAQRFVAEEGNETRSQIDKMMTQARLLAAAGACVILISSMARQKSSNGSSTYSGLNLATFRGSAELEYGADSAYILHNTDEGKAKLECVKSRFDQQTDITLQFEGEYQRFDARVEAEEVDLKKKWGKK